MSVTGPLWRRVRLEAPAARLRDLLVAAGGAGFDVVEHGVSEEGAGWVGHGAARAFAVVLVPARVGVVPDTEALVREHHRQVTGEQLATWVEAVDDGVHAAPCVPACQAGQVAAHLRAAEDARTAAERAVGPERALAEWAVARAVAALSGTVARDDVQGLVAAA